MQVSYTLDQYNSGRTVVGEAITQLAKDDPRIWLLTPDIGWGCNDFKAAHPERFIDTGIAEQCVVGVSAGLALEGNIPFIIGMMPFMSMRALEQVRTDLCYPNLPVRIIANYSGLTGNGGSTHYAMEDMALFSSLVNMTVCAPADPNQLKQIILKSVDWKGPMSIRMDPGKNNAILYPEDVQFEIGKAYTAREGKDITIIATGLMVGEAVKAAKALEAAGIDARVINIHTIKPIDRELIVKAAKETGRIVTVEEHNIIGGLGEAVSAVVCEECPVPVTRIGVNDVFGHSGPAVDLLKEFGLSADHIEEVVKNVLKKA